MTRLIEIINNTLILKKQVLEQELEEVINDKQGKVGERIKKVTDIISKLAETDSSTKTLNTYINNNNNNK
jgi:hypothetical protein|tara:strand:- start:3264 stop:3473 length:210 start_codon:yes stop_codon:yes gene_type:complete